MNKKIIATAACAVLALALTGCGSKAEEPNLPNPNASASSSGYTVTDASKLKSLSVGESAVWRDYEVAVKSIDRANDQLNVQIEFKAHSSAQELSTECLLSFGMPPVSSTFANNTISVPAGETASGTLTFDDRYSSQRLFWNDGTTEATWLLDQTPVTAEPEPQPEPQPNPPLTPDPDKPLEVLDVSALNFGPFLFSGMYWNYWNSKEAPDAKWNSTADLSKWKHGASPLGWGDRDAGTPFDLPAKDRAITNYFVRDVNFGTLSADFEVTLDVRVDDGAVIYVNGTEIKRVNMPEGTIDANTRASSNVGLAKAKDNLVRITVPRKVLKTALTASPSRSTPTTRAPHPSPST